MKQSKLFTKTFKRAPKEAQASSHKLLVRAGFIDQTMGGVYTFLPLGFKVLKKIENIIRMAMQEPPINGQEILMPALNPKENWQKTGRWDNFNALFKLKGIDGKEYTLGPTHEEIVSPLAKKFILSYKDLPFAVFQIQNKFRNELRAKSGLLRTREFMMKDLYSFHAEEKDLDDYYQKVGSAYLKIFKACGIRNENPKNKITYQTLASGGTFSKYSHEFQTVTESGEDIIYICDKCYIAVNADIKKEDVACLNCGASHLRKAKAVEVGNIFKLGTKYSLPFYLNFRDRKGKENPVIMGCYGMGLGRLMGAIVEVNHDDKGIIWPKKVAPFLVHFIKIENNKKIEKIAEKLYNNLQKAGFEVLYDDRIDKTAGEKLVDADLIGIPYRIVVSEKTLKQKAVEVKERSKNKFKLVKIASLLNFLKSYAK